MAGVGLAAAGLIVQQLKRRDVARLLVPGFVSTAQRHDLFAAADMVLLSFRKGFYRESATLMDAVAHGLPVVVSGESFAAELVTRYGLGMVFTPGEVRSLVDAVCRTPAELPADVIARAQSELSQTAIARRFLELAGLEPADTR